MEKLQIQKLRIQDSTLSARTARPLEFGAWCFSGAWCLVLGACLLFLASPLSAQTNTPVSATPSNRYLLILDTSRGMQRRADGALQAVQDLLASGMSGQLRPGDTLGIWTFNEDVYPGRFPLQRWTPETHRAIAIRMMNFLKAQKYEKQANLDKVLPAMDRVIKGSDFITVILISDGDQKIHGTPFDDRINNFYKLWQGEQQKARMPFITVLRARNGSVTAHSVNSAPWPVEIPPSPPEVAAPAATEKKPPQVQRPAPQPLIISGKKPDPIQPVKPPEPAATAIPATPEIKKIEPPSLSPEKVTSEPIPKPSPSPVAVARPGPETKSPAPAPAKSEAAPSRPAPVAAAGPSSAFGSSNLSSPLPAVPAQAAVVVPADNFFTPKKVLVAVVVLIVIIFGFVFLLRRGKSRPVSRVSLITQSLDRDQK